MATDNRTNEPTPNQTAEQIVAAALNRLPNSIGFHAGSAYVVNVVHDLRAHGLLSEGAPSEEQVELARRALNEHYGAGHARCACGWPGVGSVTTSIGLGRHQACAALEAAARAAQGAAPQAEQATYLNVAHSSVLAGSINARRAAREVSAMQLIDAIYDPDEDDANDSVRYGYVLEQFERLRIIYADLDDPDAGPAPVLPSSGVDEGRLAEGATRSVRSAVEVVVREVVPDAVVAARVVEELEEAGLLASSLNQAKIEAYIKKLNGKGQHAGKY